LYDSLAGGPLPLIGQAMSSRNEIERRSGGNISSNVGVNYGELLTRSGNAEIVEALYREAHLDLHADLDALARAPRVTPDARAQMWAAPGVFNGAIRIPVLTVNGIGDNISPVSGQESYQQAVIAAKASDMLRQTYTNTAGHCGFSAGEVLVAVEALAARVANGQWGDITNPYVLDRAADAANQGPARFVSYQPRPFMRPFPGRK
jgi:hypothetical protein